MYMKASLPSLCDSIVAGALRVACPAMCLTILLCFVTIVLLVITTVTDHDTLASMPRKKFQNDLSLQLLMCSERQVH